MGGVDQLCSVLSDLPTFCLNYTPGSTPNKPQADPLLWRGWVMDEWIGPLSPSADRASESPWLLTWGCLRGHGFVFFLWGTAISGPVYSGLIHISENPMFCCLLPLASLWHILIHSRCTDCIVRGLFLPLITILTWRVSTILLTKGESRKLSLYSVVAHYAFSYNNILEQIRY